MLYRLIRIQLFGPGSRGWLLNIAGVCAYVCASGQAPLAVWPINRRIEEERYVQVFVRDNNIDQALRALKKKMQREGVFREMKLRKHYEKPSEKRVREKAKRSVAPASWPAKSCNARVCYR